MDDYSDFLHAPDGDFYRTRTTPATRSLDADQGTSGLLAGSGLSLVTLELPWKDNLPKCSCVPPGVYTCRARLSPRFGMVIAVADVPGRTDILIHAGNWAGDAGLGFRSDSRGCILPGRTLGELAGQRAVLGSREALEDLLVWAGEDEFILEIIGGGK
ncbi:MAG: DUF5675 family protein [Desulfovibrionaceae bacterium]|nr:DUF5675 family protein [Desulfovibrionaceae bacterium]